MLSLTSALSLAFGVLVSTEGTEIAKYPCSANVTELKGTKLYNEICHREAMIRGLDGVPGQCYLDVRRDKQSEAESKANEMGSFGCELRGKRPFELQAEIYRMFNNQLSLDKRSEDRQPFAIAYPVTPEHIQSLVKLAARLQWPVFIVGAGHGAEAWGNGNGLIISMFGRRELEVIDDGSKFGWDGPVLKFGCGVVWAETYATAERAKSFMCGGSCGTVGACGFFMGGGFGYLSGQLGFAADNVLQMDVVTASGDILTASPTQNRDLFDALRGGGQVGLAVVYDVHYKLHPRKRFGCIFKISLAYKHSPEEGGKDPAWAMQLAELDPRALNVKLRWQCDEENGESFKFKLTLILLADPDISSKEAAAGHLKKLLERVKAPLPMGEFCSDAPVGDWMKCLLGTKEKPTSFHNCDTGDEAQGLDFSGADGELVVPSTDQSSDNEWGHDSSWHNMASNKKRPNVASLYSAGYAHRTTLKSLLVKELTGEMLGIARNGICDRKAGGTYIAAVWWGNGGWKIPGTGSVADVHKPFKYLFIISSDFRSDMQDNGALAWSSRMLQKLYSASASGGLLYPNLYDRMFVYNSSVPPFRDVLTYEYRPNLTFGEKAKMVIEAKHKWDPNFLFPSRFHHYMERGEPANELLDAWSASKHMPMRVVPAGVPAVDSIRFAGQYGLFGIVTCVCAVLGCYACRRTGRSQSSGLTGGYVQAE